MRTKMMIGFAATGLLLAGTAVSAETYSVDAVLESGVALVGEEVSIEVNIEAVQQTDEK